MKTLYMSIILFCLFISISHADNGLISHSVIGSDYVGCFKEDNLDSFISYSISKDYDAMRAMFGRCFFLKKGTIVYLENFRITGKVKLRMRGKTSTFWTVREAIN